MRWLLVCILIAGCASPAVSTEPAATPGDPYMEVVASANSGNGGNGSGDGDASASALGSLDLGRCDGIEFRIPSPEEVPEDVLPDNMTFALEDGQMVIFGVTRSCDEASFTLAGILVDVTGAYAADGLHAVLVHVAVDGDGMLAALADWGLYVPEQRAWDIQALDESTFLETDDAGDNADGSPLNGVLHLTRNNMLRVRDASGTAPGTEAVRFYELWDGIGMVLDVSSIEHEGEKGEAELRSVDTRVDFAAGLTGEGIVVDDVATTLTGWP